MNTPEFTNNKERYLYHLEEFKNVSGSASAYCRQNDLKSSMFSFYKRKQQRKERKPFAAVNVQQQALVGLKNAPTKTKLAEPEWIAQFIFHLLALR